MAQSQRQVEPLPVLRAAERVPVRMLQGPQYRIEDRVTNDGLMNHYRIVSDYGAFEAHSDAELAKRVQEIGAIAKLKQVQGSAEFAKGIA